MKIKKEEFPFWDALCVSLFVAGMNQPSENPKEGLLEHIKNIPVLCDLLVAERRKREGEEESTE